jgi:phosphosulfolactate phosphohydrolase-like enzyme
VSASSAARDLVAKGYRDDVLAATDADRYDVVPVYAERQITLSKTVGETSSR